MFVFCLLSSLSVYSNQGVHGARTDEVGIVGCSCNNVYLFISLTGLDRTRHHFFNILDIRLHISTIDVMENFCCRWQKTITFRLFVPSRLSLLASPSGIFSGPEMTVRIIEDVGHTPAAVPMSVSLFVIIYIQKQPYLRLPFFVVAVAAVDNYIIDIT